MNPRTFRVWRLPLAAGVTCAVVLAAFAIVLYGPAPAHPGSDVPPAAAPPSSTIVTVDGWDMPISYWTQHPRDTSYLTSPDCDACPQNLTPGSTFSIQFTLKNGDASTPHTFTNLSIAAPFQLVAVSPSLPAALPAGQSVVVHLTLIAPTAPGNYFLVGTVGAD